MPHKGSEADINGVSAPGPLYPRTNRCAAKTTRGADRLRSSYHEGSQGGIVAKLDVKSDVLT